MQLPLAEGGFRVMISQPPPRRFEVSPMASPVTSLNPTPTVVRFNTAVLQPLAQSAAGQSAAGQPEMAQSPCGHSSGGLSSGGLCCRIESESSISTCGGSPSPGPLMRAGGFGSAVGGNNCSLSAGASATGAAEGVVEAADNALMRNIARQLGGVSEATEKWRTSVNMSAFQVSRDPETGRMMGSYILQVSVIQYQHTHLCITIYK